MLKNSAREHIKQNTKVIKGEIQGIDDEIAHLHESLLNVSARHESATRPVSSQGRVFNELTN